MGRFIYLATTFDDIYNLAAFKNTTEADKFIYVSNTIK